jgi:acyl-CoA reductase-like NAD-dependent aldehyde dehydrogenase
MREYLKFYIDGKWVDPVELKTVDVINPATEAGCGRIALGSAADVDRAVKAARKAFATWSLTSREERLEALKRILGGISEAHRRSRCGGHRRDGRAEAAREWLSGGLGPAI